MDHKLILESLLYYSPAFRKALVRVPHKISKDILSMEGQDIKPDITFIDMDEDGTVTFSSMDKSISKIDNFLNWTTHLDTNFNSSEADDIYNYDKNGQGPNVYTPNRNQIRIGKLVNKIFSRKYSDSDIEDFVNLLKSSLNSKHEFEILSGKDIINGYMSGNYQYINGTLGNSCMNNKHYFELYVDNPDVCQLLVLKDQGMIIGRAIIWKLNSIVVSKSKFTKSKELPVKYFMDRVYTVEDYLVNKFHKYAEKNNYCYRHYNQKEIMYNNTYYTVEMTVKVKPKEYKYYPYLDTFCRFNVKDGILYNDYNADKIGHILTSTSGNYSSKFYPKYPLLKKFKDFFS